MIVRIAYLIIVTISNQSVIKRHAASLMIRQFLHRYRLITPDRHSFPSLNHRINVITFKEENTRRVKGHFTSHMRVHYLASMVIAIGLRTIIRRTRIRSSVNHHYHFPNRSIERSNEDAHVLILRAIRSAAKDTSTRRLRRTVKEGVAVPWQAM